MHPEVHDPAHIKGLRTVATVEFTKGIVVVLAGLGVISMRHHDIWDVAESLLEFLHANPNHRYVGVFIDLVYSLSDVQLWKIAVLAFLYATLRFVEAGGLWYACTWAEWLAVASGGVYIPFEIADLCRHPTPFRFAILAVNTVIVLYILMLRIGALRKRRAIKQAAETG